MPAETVQTKVQESTIERFHNFYTCPDDDTSWEDHWSCACNDRCPECGSEIEPHASIDTFEDITLEMDGNEFSLASWLETNLFDKEVDHVSEEDALAVIALEVGESVPVNISHITRIK